MQGRGVAQADTGVQRSRLPNGGDRASGIKVAQKARRGIASVDIDAKVAIHPTQVAVIRDAYAPTADQVKWARSDLETARGERGVFQFEGIMVDAPVLRRAERIVQLAPHPGA